MIDWFFATLKQYPEIAIFLALAFGYYFGKFTYKGIGLGAVTATLISAVVIGQIGITISQPLKAFSFLMFLFAVGYGVGPQFVRGIAKDGVPQAVFSVVQCVLCLLAVVVIAKVAGYDLGYAAGLYSGSQTISAAMGLNSEQRAWLRTGLSPGVFVGQLAEGRWREPFVFRIPPMRLQPPDAQAHAGLGDLRQLPSEASRW
jgi:putative transport protein